ncbi:MAG: glutamate--tRNA ligase, partial [Cyclobacteriaceae bacterium]|nr:glutamate--tRNA ligase [Cyclobacteriaceae bacterium]
LRERITFPKDIAELGKIFFIAPKSFDEKIASKKWNEEAIAVISVLKDELKKSDGLTVETATSALEKATQQSGIAQGKIMQALRLALTGGASGPDLMITMVLLGGLETSSRLAYALDTLGGK